MLQTKVEQFNAGKKNHSGAAYNLINAAYENNSRGIKLQ
jgi:hypothetical protein